MFQNIFAIDELSYLDQKKKEENTPQYYLDNFNCYLPKLEKDFYLRVFIKKILFDIDILEVEEFLNFQYYNSKNSQNLIKTLNLKVIPYTQNIISNSALSLEGGLKYYNQIELENDFVETEGVVKNRYYEKSMFYHWASINKLKEELEQRMIIISDFIKNTEKTENPNTLSWRGKPSHLAFLIRNMIDEGYITPPIGNDKEINLTELSRQIQDAFNIEKGTTINTLRVYLNSESDKHINLKEKFNNEGFNIPDYGLIG